MKIKEIRTYGLDEVSEITSLTAEEWVEARDVRGVQKDTSSWSLDSSYNYFYEYFVYSEGTVGHVFRGGNRNFGLRPAFRFSDLKAEVGEKIFVGNTICTVIGRNVALSDIVFHRRKYDTEECEYHMITIDDEELKEML